MNTEKWEECTDVQASKAKKAQALDTVDGWRPVEFKREFAKWADGDHEYMQTVIGRRWRRAVEEPESEYTEAAILIQEHRRIVCGIGIDIAMNRENFVCFKFANGDTAPTPTLAFDRDKNRANWVNADEREDFTWDHATHVVFKKK